MSFKKNIKKISSFMLVGVISAGLLVGCGSGSDDNKDTGSSGTGLSGNIAIDGSSTVYPITEAVAEEFQKTNKDVKVTVGFSGTGGGFEKFIAKEVDINNASRGIKDEEKSKAQEAGVSYKEIKIGYDGLTIVVNHDNTWVDSLTIDELKKIWEPNSKVKTWQDVRPEWPAENINLYGPGSDSGTFDYFTEVVTGKTGAIRADYTASEDDNVLVNGVAGDKNSIGFFGYAYYVENQDKLKEIGVDSGSGAVVPTIETIKNGTYAPLSRPLYIYVREDALEQAQIKEFVKYYLGDGRSLVEQVGYVPLNDEEYDSELSQIK